MLAAGCPMLAACCWLLLADCCLPTAARRLLPAACCLLLGACLLVVACCLLPDACCLVFAVCCLLLAACWSAACCLPCAGCCGLLDACRLLPARFRLLLLLPMQDVPRFVEARALRCALVAAYGKCDVAGLLILCRSSLACWPVLTNEFDDGEPRFGC